MASAGGGRVKASIAIAVAVSALVAGRALYRAPLEPETMIIVAASMAWILGLSILALGRSSGFYLAAVAGLLFVNARMFSLLPGDDPYTWLADVALSMLGYAFSTFEAAIAWRATRGRG